MSEDNDKPGILPSWFETGTVVALLVPLFYTAGWSYAYHYMERFNLGLTGLELSTEQFFVYSFRAIADQFWLFLLLMALLAFVLVFWKIGVRWLAGKFQIGSNDRMLLFLALFIFPTVVFGLFSAFYHMGEEAAANAYERQVENDFHSYSRVQVWANAPEKAEYKDEMAKEWQKGCYRLLMRTKDHVYLFYAKKQGGKTPTDILPAGKVEMVRVLPVNASCED